LQRHIGMTIRVRLALSFGLTLVLFCLNLVAYFVTSQSKDESLRRLRTAAERRVQWGAFEHDIRDRWQEISVLSELPLTAGQSAEVARRLERLGARFASVEAPDPRTRDRMTRIARNHKNLESIWTTDAAGKGAEAVGVIVSELGALKSEEDARVAEEASRLTDLTALMHRLSLIAFALSIGAAVLIAVQFSRYLTRRVRALQIGAEHVGAGDFTYRIEGIREGQSDELNHLARAFNDMACRLSHAMQEVTEARARAEHASRAKSAFLANMSHELRTPLLAVQGYAELVREEAEKLNVEQIVADASQIESAGRHLSTLLNEVLDLSKIESGKLTLVIEEMDLRQVVDAVTATVKPLIAQNANSLAARVQPDAEHMWGDELKIRQILLNILGNAAKFTTGGDITLDVIRARTPEGEPAVQFIVRDTGIGMTPEQTARIFEEFEQAEPTTARAYGGSGLGLAICKKLSHLMNGDIVVDSELARGTTFTITLPTSPRREVPDDDYVGAAAANGWTS
jgi:signal transduction histidine kinase